MDVGMADGTPVVITAGGPFGTLEKILDWRFAPEVVRGGQHGRYRGPHPRVEDWHMIEVPTPGGLRYCPLHRVQFEIRGV